jgi:acyl-CoA reductase-like NAD-dependent aldehyde dehydrogenase
MQSTQMDVREYSYFAGNQWRKAADNQVFEVHEPYSGKLFARVAAGTRADGRTAVDAAAKAFEGWAATTPAEKTHLFLKASEIVKRRRSEIHAPMGGVRDSGWGRTGPRSLDDFSDVIWINSHSGQRQYPF